MCSAALCLHQPKGSMQEERRKKGPCLVVVLLRPERQPALAAPVDDLLQPRRRVRRLALRLIRHRSLSNKYPGIYPSRRPLRMPRQRGCCATWTQTYMLPCTLKSTFACTFDRTLNTLGCTLARMLVQPLNRCVKAGASTEQEQRWADERRSTKAAPSALPRDAKAIAITGAVAVIGIQETSSSSSRVARLGH